MVEWCLCGITQRAFSESNSVEICGGAQYQQDVACLQIVSNGRFSMFSMYVIIAASDTTKYLYIPF